MNGVAAYLNSQAVTGDCCFINGLNNQRGYDIADGAVWDIQYVEGKGWSLKNVGTGKYLKDANSPAKYDEPTYFSFYTLKEGMPTGIEEISEELKVKSEEFATARWYTLDGREIANGQKPKAKGLYIVNGKKIVIK